ncbi:MAG: 5'/3'-nucleotidase SurE [bacterium]|nr:5'/3'-nucleotidase SurE [bacterium]
MKILITNDDGVRAPGIIALASALKEIADVILVAPESQQSAVGHSITLHKPLRCVELDNFPIDGIKAFSTNGTPTDSILLGIHAVIGEKPDLVISGINGGPNLGADVTYSGTVAGALEGVVAGIPSISCSMGGFENLDYKGCAEFVKILARIVHEESLPDGILLNINYPNIPEEEIKGIKITRLGQRWYDDVVHERVDPRGRKYYWITGKKVLYGRQEGTDSHEIENGFISITPLGLDITSIEYLVNVADMLSCYTGVKSANKSGLKIPYEVFGPTACK